LKTKRILTWTLAIAAIAVAIIQFVPGPPLVVPADLPPAERSAHRLLNFEGVANFRDLGGYRTEDGRQVKWGRLYRSGKWADASRADQAGLQHLGLHTFIDFRSSLEKTEEPDQLPASPGFEIREIPVLDDGNEAMVKEIRDRIESGNFEGFDAATAMLEANRQFADQFTPQFSEFAHAVLAANGAPVLWHCTAGKDRAGFAAAIMLRILGVPQETVMADYMASQQPSLEASRKQLLMLKLFRGDEAAEVVKVMMGVDPAWLQAGFDQIDRRWGSFDNYVSNGLQLTPADVQQLRDTLLE
jgi:protein-tyrosine phosphatase